MSNLVIYADESDTHDGSTHSFVAGWIADESFWNGFVERWQSVLNKYKVERFHFKEWTKACYIKNNPGKNHPYYRWIYFKWAGLVVSHHKSQ